MDGNRRVGDPLDAAASKRFPDLFVATTMAVYSNAPVGCRAATKVKADGIATLFHRAVAVVTVGKQGSVAPEKFLTATKTIGQDFFLASISMMRSTSSPIAPR